MHLEERCEGFITVTAKQLRLKTSEILKKVRKGNDVMVTFRGRPVARIVSVGGRRKGKDLLDFAAIGMWADRKDMSDASAWVRKIRKPRYSLH